MRSISGSGPCGPPGGGNPGGGLLKSGRGIPGIGGGPHGLGPGPGPGPARNT